MKPVREDWLKLTIEKAVDPELLICDPHHHLWYEEDNPYTVKDLALDISGGHRVTHTVFVESRKMMRKDGPAFMQPVGETEFVREVTGCFLQSTPGTTVISSGIVGFADLTLGDSVIPVLEAHLEAGQGRFRGIRYSTTWDASPGIKCSAPKGIMGDSKFRLGFSCLRKYNLSFDAWLYHPQLTELVDLARSFPDIPIILDHIGGPLGTGPYAGHRDEVFQNWKTGISLLAECENVCVKLGGLGMDICGFEWSARSVPPRSSELAKSFSPYFLWCIEKFGVKRCMFESNFPVDKRAYSYTVVWNSFKTICKDFSPEERRYLFHDSAVNAYHLK